MTKQYCQPFHLSSLDPDSEATALTPVPYVEAKGKEGVRYNENWLQQLIAAHPNIVPFAELVEPTFATATSICTELPIAGNYLDNLLATDSGGIVLVECKLWRNPEARRSVIGQILDYATELSKWDYEKLDVAVRRARPPHGVSKETNLFTRAKSSEGLEEKDFVDEVTRNLKRGRFLLLVIGDGIREGLESMAGFLQSHAGLRFTLGVAEMAVYQLPNGHYLAQPRVLAHTVMIERGVVDLRDERIIVQPPPDPSTGLRIPATISEEAMIEQLEAREPSLGKQLRAFIKRMEPIGVVQELTPTAIRLIGRANDDRWPLVTIEPKLNLAWFDAMATKAKAAGRLEDALRLYDRLVNLLDDGDLRREKLAPGPNKDCSKALPLSLLLQKAEHWASALEEYLHAVSAGANQTV
jgi:hypothetical protein